MLTNRRVLIVESVPELRRYVHSLLEAQGASVEDAASGAEALHRFVEGDFYDLVLLDSQPSGRDGLHGLQQIRALNQDCTIVLLGSTGADSRIMAGRRQGADGYLERQHLLPESSNISRVLF